MSYLYITSPNLSCNFSENQLVIKKDNKIIDTEPIETIDTLILRESSIISSKSISQLLKRDIPIVYVDKNYRIYGEFLGRKVNINRQVEQFKCKLDDGFCLDFSKKIIKTKIKNQEIILKRFNKANLDSVNDKTDTLNRYSIKIDSCSSIEEIMGIEGNSAKIYFEAISNLLGEPFQFEKRSKRPPKDPFNSMINFGYSLLYNEIALALNNTGLNSYAGFMHQNKNGHAALASDLIEQWRAPIIDSLVLKLISKNLISHDDFTIIPETGACYLTKEANAKFLNAYEEKMLTKNHYFRSENKSMSLRNGIYFNIHRLIDALESGSIDDFKTFKLR